MNSLMGRLASRARTIRAGINRGARSIANNQRAPGIVRRVARSVQRATAGNS